MGEVQVLWDTAGDVLVFDTSSLGEKGFTLFDILSNMLRSGNVTLRGEPGLVNAMFTVDNEGGVDTMASISFDDNTIVKIGNKKLR